MFGGGAAGHGTDTEMYAAIGDRGDLREPLPIQGRHVTLGIQGYGACSPGRCCCAAVTGEGAGAASQCERCYTAVMENTKQTEDRIARVLESKPQINRDALERSRQVEEQLAAIGIRLDDYRLGPALGGHRGSPRVSPGGPHRSGCAR